MITIFSLGPGMYAVETKEGNPRIKRGRMRVYCLRLEAYELEDSKKDDEEITFEVLFHQADGRPEIARALLRLGDSIALNREALEIEAGE